MYLKRLELVGFKSFASKTILDFPAGIASVVGPNGSGKSNIIDAIRWLLGERESKNMRSLKAEDLIFSGTKERARVGLAQATIVFDNKGNFFPVDYGEVSIKRKLERDGVSKYFLNDSEVRLKDIIDFFAKSRLGTKGFSIVNQGDSDLFVRSTPKERRAMLEEILGLRQFQLKKHESELKLKNTRVNMDKAQALINEIMPHLRLLRRQTSKWEKHAFFEEELRNIENIYFGYRLQEIESGAKAVEPEIKNLDSKIIELNKELSEYQDELKKVEKNQPRKDGDFVELQKEKNQALDKRSELQKALGRLEAKIEMAATDENYEFDPRQLVKFLEEIRERLEDILFESDMNVIKKILQELFEKINETLDEDKNDGVSEKSEEVYKLDSLKGEILRELETIDKKLSSYTDLENKISEELQFFNQNFKKAYNQVESKKDEINSLTNQKNKLLFEQERTKIKKEELAHELNQSDRDLQEFKSVKLPSGINKEEIKNFERKIFKLRSEISTIGEIDEGLIKEAKETEERYQFLSGQLKDLEKAVEDLTDLIKELETKIKNDFTKFLKDINNEFHNHFRIMFGGGSAKLKLTKDSPPPITDFVPQENMIMESEKEDKRDSVGIEIDVTIPRKRINSLDMLSGGEKSLVSLAALFSLISVSPPPFLVLDEVDAALDEDNSRRFASLVKEFSKKTQFLIVTHNRSTMAVADILYGVTMGDDGVSKVLSLKLEE